MRKPLLWISIFVTLSSGTFVWCLGELGFLELEPLQAAEEAKPTGESTPSEGSKVEAGKTEAGESANSAAPTDHVLLLKERELTERESVIQEQLKRTDKYISELKEKVSKLEAERRRLSAANEIEKKQLIATKDSEKKRALASKDNEISKLRSELKGIKDSRVQNYISMYEKMDSKKAAKILDGLDIRLASEILSDMKQAKAAEILGLMDPERARKLTERPFEKKGIKKVEEPHAGDSNSPLADLNQGQ